ncbi:hypothetical protein D5R81_16795 [Parashewanella spongiae]|uniref:Uncharacterized protein n=1 Tax=Parashewanella spongiae TaxID=342950 RepID=A0A3A6TH92_9GAMM|nr:hypothetical protein [Parashewanella spongiae]MCL1079685.1 hypothetical protein [Parashewanella spongiae]RJY07044.1 hypothetical protein D5R81_16795 [Parashewanella spongiae]
MSDNMDVENSELEKLKAESELNILETRKLKMETELIKLETQKLELETELLKLQNQQNEKRLKYWWLPTVMGRDFIYLAIIIGLLLYI